MSASHGNTPAAWIGVSVVLAGFIIGGVGLVMESMLVFWIGVAFLPVGALVGMALGKTGLGSDVPVER
jgi:hypothetical protein